MTILSDIKAHLTSNGIVTDEECKYNFHGTEDELTILWQYGGYETDIGVQPTIQIKVLSLNPVNAETKINAIYDSLINRRVNKIKKINGNFMKITANQQPFFDEKDEQNRYIWIFNITVTAIRK